MKDKVQAQPRIAMIVGGAVLAAALAAALLWGRGGEYRVLYANLTDRDGGAIVAALQQMNEPYRISESGSVILVPADRAPDLRLKLANQGLPKAGGVGFELLDNQKFGTSQFQEQINYQRGLEGELARSIESIRAVQSARVHLALPKASLFVRDQKKPSASVLLTLHPGRSVDEGQVSAIVHMVASSVPEMDDKSVTVVDQRGNLLSSASGAARGLDTTQLKYVERIEQSYVRRIEGLLQPIVGPGNVRAQVAADVDFTVSEGTEEKYRPNQEAGTTAIRSQQTTESQQDGAAAVGGVPGALSNQAPATPTAPLGSASSPAKPLAAVPTKTGRSSSRRDVTTNYEVDRSIRHTQQSGGAIRHLNVGVVVNNREVRDAKGKVSMVPLTAAELTQVTNLVKEAMGFNQARGDSVNVVNTPFTVEIIPQVDVPPWKDPQTIELAKTVAAFAFAGIAALVVLVMAMLRRRKPAMVDLQAIESAAPGEESQALGAPLSALQIAQTERDAAVEREKSRREADIEFARNTATADPQLVASLLRHWLTT